MASIKKRGSKYCVIYTYIDGDGNRKQKWETYATQAEAKRRKKEIDYKSEIGTITIPKCVLLKELMNEYISLYGNPACSSGYIIHHKNAPQKLSD